MQPDAGRTEEASAADPLVVNTWESVNVELKIAQIAVLTTIEKVLALGCEALDLRDVVQQRSTSKEREAARDCQAGARLEVYLFDAELKLEMMENWKKRITDAHQKAPVAFLKVAEVKGELGMVAQKRN